MIRSLKGNSGYWRVLIASAIGLNIGFASQSYIALTIGVYVEGYAMPLRQAGLFGSTELIAMAISALLSVRLEKRISLASLAIIGALLAGLGNVLTAFQQSVPHILLLRIMTGVGAGIVAATVNASIAKSADPVRLYAHSNAVVIFLASCFFITMPYIYSTFGYSNYFLAYGLILLAGTPLLAWLGSSAPSSGHADQLIPAPPSMSSLPTRWLVYLGSGFLLWLSYGMIFSFSERLGVSLGIAPTDIGIVISVGTLVGIFGTLLAALVAGKTDSINPLSFGVLALGICYVVVSQALGYFTYSIAMCLFGIALFLCLPFLQGEAARFDPSGRLASLLAGLMPLAGALSPVIGGWLIESLGYGWLGIICFFIACGVSGATRVFRLKVSKLV
jgi:predicted MFS family arabinose efflux permease